MMWMMCEHSLFLRKIGIPKQRPCPRGRESTNDTLQCCTLRAALEIFLFLKCKNVCSCSWDARIERYHNRSIMRVWKLKLRSQKKIVQWYYVISSCFTFCFGREACFSTHICLQPCSVQPNSTFVLRSRKLQETLDRIVEIGSCTPSRCMQNEPRSFRTQADHNLTSDHTLA